MFSYAHSQMFSVCKKCPLNLSRLVLKMPVCTRARGQSAHPALWFTPLPFVELMATPTPPRYLPTQSQHLSPIEDIWARISYISSWWETHSDFTSFSASVARAQCKLDYQACITGKKIAVKCPGMCPCPSQPEQSSAEKKGTRFCTHDCTPQARILWRGNYA